MRPGTTKAATLTTGYQRLATLYDGNFTDSIKSNDGNETANQVLLSIRTADAEIAYGETMPIVAGHPLAVYDSMTMANQEFIRRAWLRGVSGSIAIITPIYE